MDRKMALTSLDIIESICDTIDFSEELIRIDV